MTPAMRFFAAVLCALAGLGCLGAAMVYFHSAWQFVVPPQRPTPRVLMLGPTTGETLRPSHTVGGIQFYHYVEHRKADNSGPAKETK